MLDLDFNNCFSCTDIELICFSVFDAINNGCNKFIPWFTKPTLKHPCWYSPSIKHSLIQIQTISRKIKSKPCLSPSLPLRLVSLENDQESKIAKDKEVYQLHLITTNCLFLMKREGCFDIFKTLSEIMVHQISIAWWWYCMWWWE